MIDINCFSHLSMFYNDDSLVPDKILCPTAFTIYSVVYCVVHRKFAFVRVGIGRD